MSQSTRPSRFIPQVRSASAAATPVASTSSPAAADTEELQRLRNEVELLRQQTIDAQRRFQQQLDQLAEQQAAPAPIRRKRAKLPGLSVSALLISMLYMPIICPSTTFARLTSSLAHPRVFPGILPHPFTAVM